MDESTPKKEVVLGILRSAVSGKVLIVSRVHKERTSEGKFLTYAFPGGTINEGETFEQALVREIKEETGYDVSVIKQISERYYAPLSVHLYYYECELNKNVAGIIEETHEIESIKWVEPERLSKFFTTDLDPGVAKHLGL